MKTLGKRQAGELLDKLRHMKRIQTMETSSFYLPDEKHYEGIKPGAPKDTLRIREATKLWRYSYLELPLADIIEALEAIYEPTRTICPRCRNTGAWQQIGRNEWQCTKCGLIKDDTERREDI